MSTAGQRTESITVRVTPEAKQWIVDAAEREEREFSDMCRLLWQRGADASSKPTTNKAHGTVNSVFNPQPKTARTKK